MLYGEENNILYPLQHGFRRGRSYETQLLEFVDDVTTNIEEGQQTDVFVMDFAKAFDKVCHSVLVHKLHHNGIRGKVNQWIKSWLTDRKQVIVVEGETTDSIRESLECTREQFWGQGCSCITSTTSHPNCTQLLACSLTIPLPT